MACAPKTVAPAPVPTARTLVVLLPDSDTDVTGRAAVSNSAGSVDLAAARDSVAGDTGAHTRSGHHDERGGSAAHLRRGARRAAAGTATLHALLQIRIERADRRVAGARAGDPQPRQVRGSIPEVLIVGHTDTMGAPKANIELGLNRATTRSRAPRAGGPRSHRPSKWDRTVKADLLVKTPDETPEPRNRRVEISVR